MEEVITKFAGKITLTEAEKKEVIHVKKHDFSSLQTTLHLSLVGKVHTTRNFDRDTFKTTMTRKWDLKKEMKMREIDDKLFLFVFGNIDDKQRVLDNAPWNFGAAMVVVDNPDGTVSPSAMEVKHAAYWVQVHNLPLLGMSWEVGRMIGDCLGECLEVEEGEGGDFWGKFMRVKVRFDITKPLKRGMQICLEGSKPCWVEFKYEDSPVVCFNCRIIGHRKNDCEED